MLWSDDFYIVVVRCIVRTTTAALHKMSDKEGVAAMVHYESTRSNLASCLPVVATVMLLTAGMFAALRF